MDLEAPLARAVHRFWVRAFVVSSDFLFDPSSALCSIPGLVVSKSSPRHGSLGGHLWVLPALFSPPFYLRQSHRSCARRPIKMFVVSSFSITVTDGNSVGKVRTVSARFEAEGPSLLFRELDGILRAIISEGIHLIRVC